MKTKSFNVRWIALEQREMAGISGKEVRHSPHVYVLIDGHGVGVRPVSPRSERFSVLRERIRTDRQVIVETVLQLAESEQRRKDMRE
jgi:hypothetical protein